MLGVGLILIRGFIMVNDRQKIILVEIPCDKCGTITEHRKYQGEGFVCLKCGGINHYPYQDNFGGCDDRHDDR